MALKKRILERDIENPVVNWAKRNGWYVRKFVSDGNRSVPDRIFIKRGRVVFIEFKAPGKKPTEKQAHEHFLIRKAGGEVHVCDDIDQAKEVLKNALI